MADVFKRHNVKSLLNGKHILFIGDSNIRALYKDLVWLYKFNSLIGLNFLKRRLEGSFLGDKLLARSDLTRGRDFTEHRMFKDNQTIIEFLFVTRCYCDSLTKLINDISNERKHCPDIILMNSCLWDVTRWGPNGVNDYKVNMDNLMKLLSASLPKRVLFIWTTALPIASITSGGLLIKQVEFLQATLRIHVIEANAFTAALVSSYAFDVLDFHFYMKYQIIRRSADGIHFLPPAMRFLTNLFLTHIALSWDVKLPSNLKTFKSPLAATVNQVVELSTSSEVKQKIDKIELLASNLNKSASDASKRKKKRFRKRKPAKSPKHNETELASNYQVSRAIVAPHYHESSPVNNRQVYYRSQYTDWDKYSEELLINVNNIQTSSSDFRLIGFNDYYRGRSNDQQDHQRYFANYYAREQYDSRDGYHDNHYTSKFSEREGTYHDRFYSYKNHPYKTSNNDRRYRDEFQRNRSNFGPIRTSRRY